VPAQPATYSQLVTSSPLTIRHIKKTPRLNAICNCVSSCDVRYCAITISHVDVVARRAYNASMRLLLFGPRIFGLRTGLSLGREDFARFAGQTTSASAIDPDHSFLYVIKGDHGLCKIGQTANPNARLAQLQTASAVPLEFAWIGAPKGDTIAIEREAHKMLDQYRRNGEWFAVAPDAAVGAIHSVAYRRGQPVLDLTADQAERIRQIACVPQSKSTTALGRVAVGLLQMVVAAVITIAVMAFVMFRVGRILF
jgi:hypothetical protein